MTPERGYHSDINASHSCLAPICSCIMANLSVIASALNALSQGAVSRASERSELEHYLQIFFVNPDSPESYDDSGKNYEY